MSTIKDDLERIIGDTDDPFTKGCLRGVAEYITLLECGVRVALDNLRGDLRVQRPRDAIAIAIGALDATNSTTRTTP